jgi:hypothetical protein
MVVPTVTVWRDSILLVLLMSLYANIEVSVAAFLSAPKKEEKSECSCSSQ